VFRVYSPQQPDTVTGEFPPPQSKVVKGSNVRINVSRGAKPVPVPSVVGQPYANAKSALEGQGFVVKRVDVPSDQEAPGVVVSSDPQAGTSSQRGATITLQVSKGPTSTTVPSVLNQTQANAESILTGAGLTPAVTFVPVTDPSQDGIVQSQTPAPGADAKSGEVVIINVGQLEAGTPGGDGGTTTTTTTPVQ
jgi:serine/threonine-protein kinase